jgi:hypothetical protein
MKTTKKPGPHEAAYMAGRNFRVTESMVDAMRKMPFPNGQKVLQAGGIIGALPFQVADEFHNQVTLAYEDPIWPEMAKVLPTIPVTFVEASPTGLDKLKGQNFDLVLLLPGELRTFFGEDLPSFIDSPLPTYWDSAEGKALLNRTKAILDGVKGVLADRGEVIVIESFSSTSLYAVARAFEHAGFYLEYPNIINPLLQQKDEFSVWHFLKVDLRHTLTTSHWPWQ